MEEDPERERGQGHALPPHATLQLVLSYCVHHCYTGTVKVLSVPSQPAYPLTHNPLSTHV